MSCYLVAPVPHMVVAGAISCFLSVWHVTVVRSARAYGDGVGSWVRYVLEEPFHCVGVVHGVFSGVVREVFRGRR